MSRSDEAQEILLRKLEDADWDMSHERLEEVAADLRSLFHSQDEALEFVEAHASSLFDMMQDAASRREFQESRRPPRPFDTDES